jgi:hypothetical protein
MLIDLRLQSELQMIIQDQITRFETNLRSHFKYIPSDDLLNDNDVTTVLESERSLGDPKVSLYYHYRMLFIHYVMFYLNFN